MSTGRLNLSSLTLVAMFAALTSVGAWIAFPLPFSPVPVAFANLFVLLAGVILGKWLGALSQVVYIMLGVIGIPVFAQFTAGPEVLVGPTGGYLVGYVLAAFVAGALVEHLPRSFPELARVPVSLVAGGLAIYLTGLPWLASYLDISFPAALVAGFYPYLPGDALKVVLATMLSASLLHQVPQVRRFTAPRLAESEEVG
ncbi:MAG: biotin transporter BioY [Thermoleophilia bacterium]